MIGKRWATLLLCAALTTACGTTLQSSSGSASSGSAGGGNQSLATSSGPGTTPATGGANSAQGASASPTGGSSPGGSAPGASSSQGAGDGTTSAGPGAADANATSPATGTQVSSLPPGQPATTGPTIAPGADIKVAFFYVDAGNALLSSAFPGTAVAFGDGKAEAQSLVNDVNAHGGINGRHLKPYFVEISATNSGDAALQQACLGAVQDDHPFAILSIFNVSKGLATCAEQTHTLFLDVALGAGDNAIYNAASDYLFTPTQISRDAEQTLVLGLAHSEGRITPATRVGILSESDDPMYGRVVTNTIEPLLKSWGIPYNVQSLSNGADTAGMSSAVLQFKTAKVSAVVFSLGSGGIPELLWMDAANGQHYTPNFLMGDSTDSSFVAGSAPATEKARIWGAGTMPLANVASNQYTTTAAEQACITLMNNSFGAGYHNRGSSLTSTLYCDLVRLFVAVGKAVPGPLSVGTWVAAYRGFGTRYMPITTFATNFSPAANYGASEYRELSWLPACSCVTYTSPIKPIG